jgi:plastocyanin
LGAGPIAAADTPSAPAALTIHIKNFMFVPMSATIRAGDRVTFVNDDDEAHTATSDDKSFDSAGLDSGGTWQHVFAKPGVVTYFCELHPYMKARITVLPATR